MKMKDEKGNDMENPPAGEAGAGAESGEPEGEKNHIPAGPDEHDEVLEVHPEGSAAIPGEQGEAIQPEIGIIILLLPDGKIAMNTDIGGRRAATKDEAYGLLCRMQKLIEAELFLIKLRRELEASAINIGKVVANEMVKNAMEQVKSGPGLFVPGGGRLHPFPGGQG